MYSVGTDSPEEKSDHCSLNRIRGAKHDDSVPGKDSSLVTLSPERRTLTGDWFGHGSAMRDVDVDLRLEWAPFYQGPPVGEGDKSWRWAVSGTNYTLSMASSTLVPFVNREWH
jgi:hypothetical protein